MVLCVGEILADMIGSYRGDGFCYERNAGGAPFNVACAVKKFGGKAGFVGNVGDDVTGDYLLNFAKGAALDELLITKDGGRNTTLAFVELDKSGERSFCFNRKNTADYHLPVIGENLLKKAEIVYVGSLMLSEKIGRNYAKKLFFRVKKCRKTIAFDVNFRADIFKNAEKAAGIYKYFMSKADIIKLSEEEVDIFSPQFISDLDGLVCISLGNRGSIWRYKGEKCEIPSISVKPVDTTGAGDAFFAGVLTKLSKKKKSEWTFEFLTEALKFGNVCGALNTQGRGAIAHLPELEKIEKYLY